MRAARGTHAHDRARSRVTASDELCVDVALLPILGEDEMRRLLLDELGKRLRLR